MVNVLPPEEIKDLWRYYRSRFVLVVSLVVCVCAMVAFVALLPSYFMLWSGSHSDEQALTTKFDADAESADLSHSRDLLNQLAPVASATTSPIDVITRLDQARPKGITFSRLSYSGGMPASLIVTGISQKREDINAFKDALQHEGIFSSVAIPIADLVGTNNSQFTITLTGNF